MASWARGSCALELAPSMTLSCHLEIFPELGGRRGLNFIL